MSRRGRFFRPRSRLDGERKNPHAPSEPRRRPLDDVTSPISADVTDAPLTRLFHREKISYPHPPAPPPEKRKISSHVGTRLITSYVVWICVCRADFPRGRMVQVRNISATCSRPGSRRRREKSGPRRSRREFLIVFFLLSLSLLLSSTPNLSRAHSLSLSHTLYLPLSLSLSLCHPLVNRKDGSRLLRFFPPVTTFVSRGRTFFPGTAAGKSPGTGRSSR